MCAERTWLLLDLGSLVRARAGAPEMRDPRRGATALRLKRIVPKKAAALCSPRARRRSNKALASMFQSHASDCSVTASRAGEAAVV